jgi:hypothetical protein
MADRKGLGSPGAAQRQAEQQVAEHAAQHKGEVRPPLREGTVHPERPPGMPEPQQRA